MASDGNAHDPKLIGEVFDRMIEDVKSVSDADGTAHVSDLYGLFDKWNRDIGFGGSNVFDLAERLDVAADWYKHLQKPRVSDLAVSAIAVTGGVCYAPVVPRQVELGNSRLRCFARNSHPSPRPAVRQGRRF
jgi:hypothetical protein